MVFSSIYILRRNGNCVFHRSWQAENDAAMAKQNGAAEVNSEAKSAGHLNFDEHCKLLYGMLLTTKNLCARLSPSDLRDGFLTYSTNKYKLHFYEAPTGIKLVLFTDVNTPNQKEVLQQIYSQYYVQYVVRNPLLNLNEQVTSDLFAAKLEEFIRALPAFQ